ncbi:SDR family NAD(P)-dependent oxidoreductase [Paenibacillus durus]|uniref:Ketoreductase n=1 Tax=Paenibacillus durus ATCC 35681 TaxID=1333534 RepID=A0A0F7FAZ6_PAEDU|nr:glucose 1-dehydrogenase [Paenibacillus durus]AKG35820.1 ketoreductase [Paenibacillus durus ATCC 35681]
MRFKDKVVIITGGGSGIGLAAARKFIDHGANVLITGRRKAQLDSVTAGSSNLQGLVADSSDPEAATRTVAAAMDYWGRIDIVVNNAGSGVIQPLVETNAKSISDIFAVNVAGPTLLASAAIPQLAKTGGSIVNLSSTYGSKAAADLSLYAASKAALEHLTRCWALELAPKGIRVNAVASGPVETEFLRERMGLSDKEITAVKEQERRAIPLGRRGVPNDVARWILNLADPEANWITGQIIAIDGGLVIT